MLIWYVRIASTESRVECQLDKVVNIDGTYLRLGDGSKFPRSRWATSHGTDASFDRPSNGPFGWQPVSDLLWEYFNNGNSGVCLIALVNAILQIAEISRDTCVIYQSMLSRVHGEHALGRPMLLDQSLIS